MVLPLRSLFLGTVASLFFIQVVFAADHFTLDQVMSAPFASHPLAAPKGSAVVWLLNEQGRRNVWTASAPEWTGRKLTQFNQDDGQEIDELCWTPDGSRILFTRGGDFETGGSNPNPALSPQLPEQAIWSVGIDGSTPKKLTEGHGPAVSPSGDVVAFLRSGQIFLMKSSGDEVKPGVYEKDASDLQWSPDGTRLAFVSRRKNHSLIGLYELSNGTVRYLDPSVDRDDHPIWSLDGARLAYIRVSASTRAFAFGPEREGEPWSIRITDAKSGKSEQVFRAAVGPGSLFHALASPQQLFWTADNRIVFPWERSGWCHLYSVASAGSDPVELTPGEGEVENASLSADRTRLFYASNISDIDRRHVSSIGISGTHARIKAETTGDGIELEPTPVADGSGLVFLTSTYNQTVHAAVRTPDGQLKALAPQTVPADFPAGSMVRPQPATITAADGLSIHGQLFLPKQSRGERHPGLIFFHGGSRRQMLLGFHYMYYYSNAYSLNQYLADQGYVVLSVNYRSGIGYGLQFREALNYGATGASEYNDVIGAGLYMKSRADVDPARLGVWGGSYGGYLTALALSRASSLFAAGVDFHGVHDWNIEIQNFVPAYDPKQRTDAAKIAWDSSPLSTVQGWRSPVLLIHGDDDRNVPFVETVQLVEALRRGHVPFEELIFPNEIHDFLLHQHWVTAYKASSQFFEQHLAPSSPQ